MKENFDKFKRSLGLAQIPLIIGLLIMAVAIPVATKLVEQNQDTRNRAAIPLPSPAPNPSTPVPTQGTVTPIPEEQNACRRAGGWCIPTGSSCVNGTTTSSLSCYPPAPGKCCMPATATNTPRPNATNTPRPNATNTPRPAVTSTPAPTSAPVPTNTSALSGVYHSCPSSDGNPNKQACCDSSGNYVDWWLCGGAGDGDGGQTLISFNGVVLDDQGYRWMPGSNCAGKEGDVEVKISSGSVKWEGIRTADVHFDVIDAPDSEVVLTLVPPTGCGYSCDKITVVDRGDDLRGNTIVRTEVGCSIAFTPQQTAFRTGINFTIKEITPTANPPIFNVTIEGPTEVVQGEAATFNAFWWGNSSANSSSIKMYYGYKATVDSLYGKSTINPWVLFKECTRDDDVAVTICQGSFPMNEIEGDYYVIVNASTGSNYHCSGNPKCSSYPCSGFYDCGAYDNMVMTLSLREEPTSTLVPTAIPTVEVTQVPSAIPTVNPTVCDWAVDVGLNGWKQQYISNRGRRIRGTWLADVNRDGFVDVVDRSIILGCLITNNVM